MTLDQLHYSIKQRDGYLSWYMEVRADPDRYDYTLRPEERPRMLGYLLGVYYTWAEKVYDMCEHV